MTDGTACDARDARGLWEDILDELEKRPWIRILGHYRRDLPYPGINGVGEQIQTEYDKGLISPSCYALMSAGLEGISRNTCSISFSIVEPTQSFRFLAPLQQECEKLEEAGGTLVCNLKIHEQSTSIDMQFTYFSDETFHLYCQILWTLLENIPI